MRTVQVGPGDYGRVANPEQALKYAMHRMERERYELVEGVITPVRSSWARERVIDVLREQVGPRMRELGLRAGSGSLDLPGSANFYLPGMALVPDELAKTEEVLLPSQTALVVEVTELSEVYTECRRRYAQYGAPLHLLVDRLERSCTLSSGPSGLGYTRTVGPHPFGVPVRLPEPFELDLDTSEF
ncbi:Uma2 family endonuclease [Kitasatospora sp. NPDC089509]|uniref:Uma2 family endonuclease n=1 Tax=Kitasatospora sp. NPDC089509 TaxID=3364079 RepID=UPI00382ACD71